MMPSPAPHTHCRGCGAPWPDPTAPWPRTCEVRGRGPLATLAAKVSPALATTLFGPPGCGKTTWQNLTPVAVVVVPLADLPGAYLGVRRAIPPALGHVVCPSGFMEAPTHDPLDPQQHWLAEAARELHEETGIDLRTTDLRLLHVASAPSNPSILLLFVETPPVSFRLTRAKFTPNEEVSELVPLRPEDPIPWPTHRDALRIHADRAQHTLEQTNLPRAARRALEKGLHDPGLSMALQAIDVHDAWAERTRTRRTP